MLEPIMPSLHVRYELARALYCKASITGDSLALSLPPQLDASWHDLILETSTYERVCKALGWKASFGTSVIPHRQQLFEKWKEGLSFLNTLLIVLKRTRILKWKL